MKSLDDQQPPLDDPVEYWKKRCKTAEKGLWDVYAQLMLLRQVSRDALKVVSYRFVDRPVIERLNELVNGKPK